MKVTTLTAYAGTAKGASKLLETVINPKKPGEFKPKKPAALNIQATLDDAKRDAVKQRIIRAALTRLKGIGQNVIQPKDPWEKTAGYLMLTGQPFKLNVDAKGKITVEAQKEAKLKEYNTAQQKMLKTALAQFDKMASKVDLEQKKLELGNKLGQAVLRIVKMEQHAPAKARWEQDFQHYKKMGTPVKVGLDNKGQLVSTNQLTHDFSEVEKQADRLKLLAARDQLKRILSGVSTATKPWEFQALGAAKSRQDFFIGLDKKGQITTMRNASIDPKTLKYTNKNILPDFLAKPAKKLKFTAPWQKQAISLYQQKKPFHLDFDASGKNLVARENNFINVMGLTKPQSRDDLILQARVNMLA